MKGKRVIQEREENTVKKWLALPAFGGYVHGVSDQGVSCEVFKQNIV